MIYAKKIPSTDKELSSLLISNGWQKINEPSNIKTAVLFSVPFMIFNFLICYAIITIFYDIFSEIRNFLTHEDGFTITLRLDYIILFYLFIFLHEIIHLVFIPNFIKSKNTYLGIKLWGGFVYTSEKIGKKRFLFIFVAPFIILSIILPVVLGLLNLFNAFIVFLIIVNAVGSSIDILNFFILASQIPKKSLIICNGFETYYKKQL